MADIGDELVAAAAEAAVSLEQIAEYESQLAGIEGLLEESPGDESLLELKRDMEELLALSRAAGVAAGASGGGGANDDDDDDGEHEDDDDEHEEEGDAALSVRERFVNALWAAPVAAEAEAEAAAQAGVARGALAFPDEEAEGGDNAPDGGGKKKPGGARKEKIRDFVLPPHLVPNETDTEAERNKKRRAAKALKNKWRLKKKEAESANRQKSWQSFQKKTGKRDASAAGAGAGSIFATKEGVADRVGVVSTKQLTEFDARKRHKHS